MCEIKGNCKIPNENPATIDNLSKTKSKPVGLLIDPELIGDIPESDKENLRFYPCKVKDNDISGNRAKITPECNFETTYQNDFIFRGKDSRRCRTYEFERSGGKCEMFYCSPPPPVAPPNFGRKKTDLKPAVKEFDNHFFQLQDPKWRISEYMDSVSKLGKEMTSYNLLKKADDQFKKNSHGLSPSTQI